MAGVEVSTGRMRDVARELEEIIAKYNQSVEKVYTIGGEIAAKWEGEASSTFKSRLSSDRELFDGMSKLLQEYAAVLYKDADIYDDAERKALEAVK